MKCLNRNKQDIWYATYNDKSPVTDNEGRLTGEYQVSYSPVKKTRVNVSPPVGEVDYRFFGSPEDYDRILVMDLPALFDEYSVLWIDRKPEIDSEGNLVLVDGVPKTPHDFIVKKVAPSLNSVLCAIKKVTVNG